MTDHDVPPHAEAKKEVVAPFLPDNKGQTADSVSDAKNKERQDNTFSQLDAAHLQEERQRRVFRWIMFGSFYPLLLLQHALMTIFVVYMVSEGHIEQVQGLLGVVIPATLGETYAIMRVMVKFTFSEGNFKQQNPNPRPNTSEAQPIQPADQSRSSR